MTSKLVFLFTSFVLILFTSAFAMAQQQEQGKSPVREGMHNLEKTLAVNLVMEPSDDPQGFTIMTADGHFMFNSNQVNPDGRTEFSFQGDLEMEGNDSALVRYHISLDNTTKLGLNSQRLDLQGSIFVPMDSQIVIVKSKDRTFKLKLTVVKP